MRTEENISTTLSDGELSYSYKMNNMEELRMRGIDEGSFNIFFQGINLIYALQTPILKDAEKSILCDVLVRKGFSTSSNVQIFSESIYDKDYDIVQ